MSKPATTVPSDVDEVEPDGPTPEELGWGGWRGTVGNIAIFVFTLFLVMDGLPSGWAGHDRINGKIIDPIVYPLGLAQGSWTLFAPNPDHINAYVEGLVTYSDGSTHQWKTQDYSGQSLLFRIIKARHAKVHDYMRMDTHKAMWPSLADWVVRNAPDKEGVRKTKVELKRHWWQVAKPADLEKDKKKYKSYPPHRDEFPNHYTYYTKRLK